MVELSVGDVKIMIRCKLEYLIKNIDIIPRKRLIFLFDKDSQFEFHRVHTKSIEEFKNKQYDLSDEYQRIMYEVEKETNESLRDKYKGIFNEINQICIENNTYPIFDDPSNIEKCLQLREDLLRVYDEKIIKKFFDGKTLRDYEPPRLREVYLYPAVFEKENDGYAVTVPDIFGGVTCGDSYEDALKMAEDMVKMMLVEAPGQCFEPKSLEETKKNFPNKIVVMIRVEIDKNCIK